MVPSGTWNSPVIGVTVKSTLVAFGIGFGAGAGC